QRRRLARSWRDDSPERLAGASLAIHGPGGLTVVLCGGPPPRQVTIRAVARTTAGRRLRQSAGMAKVPYVEDAELARRLARYPLASLPVPAGHVAELAAIWPPRPVG